MKKWLAFTLIVILSLLQFPHGNLTAASSTSQASIYYSIDQQWISNRSLLDYLDALTFEPRLGLYSKVNPLQIQRCEKMNRKILQAIDFNQKFHSMHNAILTKTAVHDLVLQNLQLRIAHAFNLSLLQRKYLNFILSLEEIENAFVLIKELELQQKEKLLLGSKPTEEFYGLAYYHKGKIHRMLAGCNLNSLDQCQLRNCEECYTEALRLSPNNPNIHSSLGYLYNDMGKADEGLKHLQLAVQLQPNNPDFIHGLAYIMYKLEKEKIDQGNSFCEDNLNKAGETFERAIQLFKEFDTLNARVFLDYGLLLILKDKPLGALDAFNKGIKLESNHYLLLLQRGLLLAKLGRHQESLYDLKKGSIATTLNKSVHEKYSEAISFVQSLRATPLAPTTATLNQNLNKETFEKALHEFKAYSDSKEKKITCFISYAWGIPEDEQWVEQFAKDLERGGCNILFDRWHTRKGHDTIDFVEKILAEETDYIIVVGSKLFLEKYNKFSKDKNKREHVLKIEMRLLNYLVGFNKQHSDRVIPVLMEGSPEESLPPLLRIKNITDFVTYSYYDQMCELLRDLHQINTHPSFQSF